jgi:hypothetical protein
VISLSWDVGTAPYTWSVGKSIFGYSRTELTLKTATPPACCLM